MIRHSNGFGLNSSYVNKIVGSRFTPGVVMLFLVLCFFSTAAAQIKKHTAYTRHTIEEYYDVNKTIRHGQYIKFHYSFFQQNVIEYGYYDKNNKTGEWLTLYSDAANSVASIGSYIKDRKEGTWKYFYPCGFPDSTVNILRMNTKSILLENMDLKELKTLVYDTSGCKLMCSGIYSDNFKAGIWNYYSPTGKIMHQYDHVHNKLLINNDADSIFNGQTYLGGRYRFLTCFYEGYNELIDHSFYRNSNVIYQIEPPSHKDRYTLVSQSSSKVFARFVAQIIEMIPDDWVVIDAACQKKVRFKVETKRKKGGGYKFWLEFI
jgi:antitoxin component YwqK of YwqJK toxin-antitoxin module